MYLHNFTLFKEQGAFGEILTNGKTIVKYISKDKLSKISNELYFLQKIKEKGNGSSYVVDLLASEVDDTGTYIEMPYYSKGDLFQYVNSDNDIPYKWYQQMLEAVNYLHDDVGIIHKDIKAENWLIADSYDLRLCDFGLAEDASNPSERKGGSPEYVAPEIIFETSINTKVDIWSIGMLFYILNSKCPPWGVWELKNRLRQVAWLRDTKKRIVSLPNLEYIDKKICNIITHALVYNKDDRSSAEECIKML